jgi:hypothetical protein
MNKYALKPVLKSLILSSMLKITLNKLSLKLQVHWNPDTECAEGNRPPHYACI